MEFFIPILISIASGALYLIAKSKSEKGLLSQQTPTLVAGFSQAILLTYLIYVFFFSDTDSSPIVPDNHQSDSTSLIESRDTADCATENSGSRRQNPSESETSIEHGTNSIEAEVFVDTAPSAIMPQSPVTVIGIPRERRRITIPGRFSGRVVNERTGGPVQNATVTVYGLETLSTNEEGRFEVNVLNAIMCENGILIDIRCEGFKIYESPILPIPIGFSQSPYLFKMKEAVKSK